MTFRWLVLRPSMQVEQFRTNKQGATLRTAKEEPTQRYDLKTKYSQRKSRTHFYLCQLLRLLNLKLILSFLECQLALLPLKSTSQDMQTSGQNENKSEKHKKCKKAMNSSRRRKERRKQHWKWEFDDGAGNTEFRLFLSSLLKERKCCTRNKFQPDTSFSVMNWGDRETDGR